MIFLIEYDRNLGKIISFTKFDNSESERSERARLEMELALNRMGVEHEVIILEASSEEALRRTHRRYFEDFAQLVEAR